MTHLSKLLFLFLFSSLSLSNELQLNRDTIAELKIMFNTFNQMSETPTRKEAREVLMALQPYTRDLSKEEELIFAKKQVYKFIVEYPLKIEKNRSVRLKDVLRLEKFVNSNEATLNPLAQWISTALIKDFKSLPQVPTDDPKNSPVINTRKKILKNWFVKIIDKPVDEINKLFESVLISCFKSYLNHLKLVVPNPSGDSDKLPLFKLVKAEKKQELDYIKLEEKPEGKLEEQKPEGWKPKET